MKALTENTLIPLGIAVIVIGGGTIWLTEVYAQVRESVAQIEKIQVRQDEFNKLVVEINGRLSRIEWNLEQRKK